MIKWIGGRDSEQYEEKNRVSSYRGYLLKMRRSQNLLAPQWGKRWFSVEGRFLKWYRQDTDAHPSGMVDLRHIRSVTKVDINGAFTFCVSSEDRNLIMRASSAAEVNNWVRTLHMHGDIARGGTGMTIVSDFNETPLSTSGAFHPHSKKTRSSGPTSFQDELESNLKKLNELEMELSMQSEDLTPEINRYKRDEEDDDMGDVLKGLPPFNASERVASVSTSKNSSSSRSKYPGGSNQNRNPNPLAESPSERQAAAANAASATKRSRAGPQRIKVPLSASSSNNSILRMDSVESIDSAPIATATTRHAGGGGGGGDGRAGGGGSRDDQKDNSESEKDRDRDRATSDSMWYNGESTATGGRSGGGGGGGGGRTYGNSSSKETSSYTKNYNNSYRGRDAKDDSLENSADSEFDISDIAPRTPKQGNSSILKPNNGGEYTFPKNSRRTTSSSAGDGRGSQTMDFAHIVPSIPPAMGGMGGAGAGAGVGGGGAGVGGGGAEIYGRHGRAEADRRAEGGSNALRSSGAARAAWG
jgi:hypothetical protein